MFWFMALGAAGLVVAVWLAVVLFNLASTEVLRRTYRYSWGEVIAHVILRRALHKRGRWSPKLAPTMVLFIKGLDPEDRVSLGAPAAAEHYVRRFEHFLHLTQADSPGLGVAEAIDLGDRLRSGAGS